jgi:hypothetical protein
MVAILAEIVHRALCRLAILALRQPSNLPAGMTSKA